MGILDDLKKWAHPYEDEDEEYEDDFPDLRDRGDTGAFADRRSAERKAEDRRNKVVNINATTQLKVVLVAPKQFELAAEIADHLRDRRAVLMNLEQTDKNIARRKELYTEEGKKYFHGNLFVPEDLERIQL